MQIDKATLKALASNTKADILKSLSERRKMPAELSRELGLAPSTTSEHLKELESLGMIKRTETGHKWVYYELTEKSRDIIKPRIPVQNIFMLSVGLILIFGSVAAYVLQSTMTFAAQNFQKSSDIPSAESGAESYIPFPEPTDIARNLPSTGALTGTDLILIIAFVVGLLLLVYGLWKWRRPNIT